jgi:hypothetical protein
VNETIVVDQKTVDEVQALLDTRGGSEGPHGSFILNGMVAQELKRTFRQSPGWRDMDDVRKEALDLIATKISRILSGRPDYDDHWADIEGYARLGRRPR